MKGKSFIVSLLATLAMTAMVFVLRDAYKDICIDHAITSVKALYNYDSSSTLSNNMSKLKDSVTEEVYKNITPENTDNILNKYSRFGEFGVSVNIVEVNDGYIIYTLNNPNISNQIKFMFKYKSNVFGKVTDVEEYILGGM